MMNGSREKAQELDAAMKLLKSYEKARSESFAPKNPELEALLEAMKESNNPLNDDFKVPGFATERAKSETIAPEPFYVVKTSTKEGKKVFINICGNEKIPAPGNWQGGIPPEVEEILQSNNECEVFLGCDNVRFPVSCSDPMTSTDNNGKPCSVFDMVFNLDIVKFSKSNKKLKLFLIEMATTWISQKYHLQLNPDFKLPNMKYKGQGVAFHQIRSSSTSLVSELPSDSDLEPSFPLLTKAQSLKLQKNPPCELDMIRTDGSQVALDDEIGPNVAKDSFEKPLPKIDIIPDVPLSSPSMCRLEKILDSQIIPTNIWSYHYGYKIGDKILRNDVAKGQADPFIHMDYSARPVEALLVMISFPLQIELEEFKIFVTYDQLIVTTKLCEPIEVFLPFCIKPEAAEASYHPSTFVLDFKLPFLPYCHALDDIRD